MKISGHGEVAGGEYNEDVRISGSGVISGDLKCTDLYASGTVKAGGVTECSGRIEVSGTGEFEYVKAKTVISSGSFSAQTLNVSERLESSGSCTVKGTLSAKEAMISGTLFGGCGASFGKAEINGRFDCDGSVEAQDLLITGSVSVLGILSAKELHIRLDHKRNMTMIRCIDGKNVRIEINKDGISGFFRKKASEISVPETIEADEIYLENTRCPLVTGRNVTVGEGCKIGKIRYYGTCVINCGAEVEKQEKLQ